MCLWVFIRLYISILYIRKVFVLKEAWTHNWIGTKSDVTLTLCNNNSAKFSILNKKEKYRPSTEKFDNVILNMVYCIIFLHLLTWRKCKELFTQAWKFCYVVPNTLGRLLFNIFYETWEISGPSLSITPIQWCFLLEALKTNLTCSLQKLLFDKWEQTSLVKQVWMSFWEKLN